MSYWNDADYLKTCREIARMGREGKRDTKEYAAANKKAATIENQKPTKKERRGSRCPKTTSSG